MKTRFSIAGFPKSVFTVAILAFLMDFCHSITLPTVPLLAVNLGVSLEFIGMMVAASSLIRLVLVQPIGIFCDRKAKKLFMVLGFLLLDINFLMLIFAISPINILIGRLLQGAGGAMFYTSAIASILEGGSKRKGLAVGFYATLMGLGFSMGPMVGGFVAEKVSYVASYVLSLCIASLAIIITLRGVKEENIPIEPSEGTRGMKEPGYRDILKNRELLIPCIGAFFTAEAIGADLSYFPIFGKDLLLSEGVIGIMLGIRAVFSTVARIPSGKAAESIGSKKLMIIAICLSAIGLFLVPQFRVVWLFPLFLGLEGIGYGMFLTSGNAYVGEVTDERNRGAAVGMYNTFSSVGSILNMTILGFIAGTFGVDNTFRFTSLMCVTGLLITLMMTKTRPTKKR